MDHETKKVEAVIEIFEFLKVTLSTVKFGSVFLIIDCLKLETWIIGLYLVKSGKKFEYKNAP